MVGTEREYEDTDMRLWHAKEAAEPPVPENQQAFAVKVGSWVVADGVVGQVTAHTLSMTTVRLSEHPWQWHGSWRQLREATADEARNTTRLR
jgi:hypothetical protein